MTKIEWVKAVADSIGGTPATWNPIRARNLETGGVGHYCQKVSTGCAGCYAERWQPRMRNPIRFAAQDVNQVEIFVDEKTLTAPLRWRKPRAVFACDMTDLFGDWIPDGWIDRIFAVMALKPDCVWMVLTKRPDRMRRYVERKRKNAPEWVTLPAGEGKVLLPYEGGWPTYVWLGTSVENQSSADARIPALRATPAAVRFLSVEPLVGPVELGPHLGPQGATEMLVDPPTIDWVIAGGESGPKARPMHPDWPRALRDQCDAAGVAFFFKQWGAWAPSGRTDAAGAFIRGTRGALVWPDGKDRSAAEASASPAPYCDGPVVNMELVGKGKAGRTLDGETFDQVPHIRARGG